jgi:hypothetical protein
MILLKDLITEIKPKSSIQPGIFDPGEPHTIDVIKPSRQTSTRQSLSKEIRGFPLTIYRPVNEGKGNWMTGTYDEVFGYSPKIRGTILLDREMLKRTLAIVEHGSREFEGIDIAIPYIVYITGEWSNLVSFSGNLVWSEDLKARELNNGYPITCHDRLR